VAGWGTRAGATASCHRGSHQCARRPVSFWVTRPQGRAEVLEPDLLGDEKECALRDHLLAFHLKTLQPETLGGLLRQFVVTQPPPAA